MATKKPVAMTMDGLTGQAEPDAAPASAVKCADLGVFFGGELPDSKVDAFRAHLAGCSGCLAHLDELFALDALGQRHLGLNEGLGLKARVAELEEALEERKKSVALLNDLFHTTREEKAKAEQALAAVLPYAESRAENLGELVGETQEAVTRLRADLAHAENNGSATQVETIDFVLTDAEGRLASARADADKAVAAVEAARKLLGSPKAAPGPLAEVLRGT